MLVVFGVLFVILIIGLLCFKLGFNVLSLFSNIWGIITAIGGFIVLAVILVSCSGC